jgi:hypothetical protein
MPTTERIGFSKCGAMREHAAAHAARTNSNNLPSFRGNMHK